MTREDLVPLEARFTVTVETRQTFTLFTVACTTCPRVWQLRSTSPSSKVAHVLEHQCPLSGETHHG